MSPIQATQIREEVMTIVACESCRQKLRIPRSREWIRVTCPTCGHEFNYRFVHRNSPGTHVPSQDSAAGAILVVLGLVLLVGGFVQFIGNRSGAFPTFPFAGFIASSVGLAMMAAALNT